MRHTIPKTIAIEVIERDKETCQRCGKKGIYITRYLRPAVVEITKDISLAPGQNYNGKGVIPFEIHHKTPILFGGDNDIDNLVLYCRKCHRSVNWMAQVKRYIAEKG